MTSSYCTVYVGNLPDGVTDEQLCGRFKRAVTDREVTRTEVVCKAGKTFGFVVFQLSGNMTHGEQYLERQSIVNSAIAYTIIRRGRDQKLQLQRGVNTML